MGAAEAPLVAEAEAVVVVAEVLWKALHSVEVAVEAVDVAVDSEAAVAAVDEEVAAEEAVAVEEDSEVEGGRASLNLE